MSVDLDLRQSAAPSELVKQISLTRIDNTVHRREPDERLKQQSPALFGFGYRKITALATTYFVFQHISRQAPSLAGLSHKEMLALSDTTICRRQLGKYGEIRSFLVELPDCMLDRRLRFRSLSRQHFKQLFLLGSLCSLANNQVDDCYNIALPLIRRNVGERHLVGLRAVDGVRNIEVGQRKLLFTQALQELNNGFTERSIRPCHSRKLNKQSFFLQSHHVIFSGCSKATAAPFSSRFKRGRLRGRSFSQTPQ